MKYKIKEYPAIFLLGAVLYPLLEILFRGRTHFSMSLLGAVCLLSIRLIDQTLGRGRFLTKSILSAVIITQLEWITGTVVNLHLHWNVWDYTGHPGNVAGQICPLFSFFWFLLSFAVLIGFRAWDLYLWERRKQRLFRLARQSRISPVTQNAPKSLR